MKCPRCLQENPAESQFCLDCGSRLGASCPTCGIELPSASRFCNKCGAPVGDATALGGHFASPQSYTPKHLAERILTSKTALEGERKQVTVLFCDIVESTRLAERLDPEVMHEIMDRTLRLMAEAVHRYEGTVNQFLGDGIMALFGAPIALEDHALRAVQAALTIQETISGYSAELKDARGVEIRLRLGVNTGPVVVGRIGDDLRMDYTAVGDTTHVAARLQALAEPGTILISEATHRLVHGHIRSEPGGMAPIKGRETPVAVFKVTSRRRERTRLELSAESGLTKLIGRQRELAVMHDCLARVKAGRGQVVGLVGDPGAGKSRLLFEFRKSLQEDDVTWLEGYCEPYSKAAPYSPILKILRANFQIEEGDNPLQIHEKVRNGALQLDPALEEILPFLYELFDISSKDYALQHLDPQIKRRRTFEALLALTMAGSQRRPLIAVVEDVHWIDSTSEDYLAFLADSLAGYPHLLLTTHRPGNLLRWADKTYYTQISLDLLTEREAETMAATLLDTRQLPAELFRIIWQKADGNPLFVEEITASLLERGIVRRGEDLHWAADASIEIPATIQDIVRARIDRLADPVKRTVQNAAVIGREFGLRILTRISEMATGLEAYLETLKRLEFIQESRIVPELEFIFKHAVIQDVAYEGLLSPRRKEIHRAICGAIEDLYADRLDEHAALLAHHYARSDHQDKAFDYALVAGDRAARLYANTEAKTLYEQALAIVRRLAPSQAAEQSQVDTILRLAAVGVTRQDIDRDLTNVEHARTLAERWGDQPRLARTLYWLGRLRYVLGDPETALSCTMQSLEIADRLGDDALAAPSVNLMGRIRAFRAEFFAAGQLLERSVAQMRVLGNKGEESTAAGLAGWVLGELGEFQRALPYADLGVRLAQEIQNPFAEAAAYLYRGLIGIASGNLALAKSDFNSARHVAERVGDRIRIYLAVWLEGQAHAMAGDLARGRVLLEESLARAQQLQTKFFLAGPKVALADCLIALGDFAAARALCQEAIQVADETGDRFFGALAYRALAEVLSEFSPADPLGAERAIKETIRIQQEIGARPELARSFLFYARLLSRLGKTEEAAGYRNQGIAMFQEMNMTWDLARAERAPGQV